VVDFIGCEDPAEIAACVQTLLPRPAISRGSISPGEPPITAGASTGPAVMDEAGYFVILPRADRRVITVEHYVYDNTLLHVVEGTSAQALYKTIIARGWVSELSHAAYLGRELARAEFSLYHNVPYVQDGA
jgi:tetrahydromethanopterin S-methyltransferase subunit A